MGCFVVALSPRRRAHFSFSIFTLFIKCTPLLSETLTFADALFGSNLGFVLAGIHVTVVTFGLPTLVRMAPVSDPLFAGHELSLQRGAHLLAHVGRFIAFWQK